MSVLCQVEADSNPFDYTLGLEEVAESRPNRIRPADKSRRHFTGFPLVFFPS